MTSIQSSSVILRMLLIARDARVVHQNVESFVNLEYMRIRFLAPRTRLREITLEDLTRAAHLHDLIPHLFRPLRLGIEIDRNCCAAIGQFERDGAPDAARPPGD